jgi:WXG100 family type VII secretion target
MEGILKVTPEKLIQSSGEFAAAGGQMKNLTGEMMSQVQGLKSVWQGEASTAYGAKFQSLQTDMDKLHRMIQEHATDLQEMASQYQSAEAGNAEQGNGLHANIIA